MHTVCQKLTTFQQAEVDTQPKEQSTIGHKAKTPVLVTVKCTRIVSGIFPVI